MTKFSGAIRAVKNANNSVSGGTNAIISQSGTLGSISDPPVDALQLVGVANSAAANICTISNAAMGQATTISIPDPGAASAVLQTALSSSVATAPDVIVRRITATSAALASAGSVVIQAHTSATSQFLIVGIQVAGLIGLSGGGGDRLVQVTDGTIVFNNAGITAAVAGGTTYTVWGGTGNPVPATGVSTVSTAGADIVMKYAGGTTDFTAGSLTLIVSLAQITA